MKKITLLTIAVFAIATITNAQVVATGSYTVGVGSVSISDVINDADNGDGVGDGAKFIDGASGTAIDEAVYFTFDGTIEDGATYTINTTVYNVNTSYCDLKFSLYNKTDNIELATIGAGVQGFNHAAGDDIKAVELNYTAVASDQGDVLEVRYIKTQAGGYRNYAIDILKLNDVAIGSSVSVVSAAGLWSVIGDTTITNTIDDADNGDGENDGAIFVDGLSAAIGQGAAFTFTDAMAEGVLYSIETNVYNPGTSYNKVVVSLYNATDNVTLVSSTVTNLPGATAAKITLSYTTLASDIGDDLVLRFVKDFDGNTSRDFSIDNVSVSGSVISTDLPSLSIEDDILKNTISIYPNPSKGIINIKNQSSIDIKSITLIDITGKILIHNSYKSSLNVSEFLGGIYFIKLETTKGAQVIKKMVLN